MVGESNLNKVVIFKMSWKWIADSELMQPNYIAKMVKILLKIFYHNFKHFKRISIIPNTNNRNKETTRSKTNIYISVQWTKNTETYSYTFCYSYAMHEWKGPNSCYLYQQNWISQIMFKRSSTKTYIYFITSFYKNSGTGKTNPLHNLAP